MRKYLFVYGTLVRDAHHEMYRHIHDHGTYAGRAYFHGRLYAVDEYPGAVPSENEIDRVAGELYEFGISTLVLPALDEYEGCGANDPQPTEFVRQEKEVFRETGESVTAWVYIYNRPVDNLRRITSGRFVDAGSCAG